ncbi:hypothetical protein [Halobacterium jilantaiense]|uniref:Uncharacterized protein n=1 Tax=Halobacterium jilantaiense TaxID=355548 RepID=A0A1I0NPL6_9EURY|nr:hypothetical protein [Halobacterium jilantaiense]SEW03358.1 hypothetical protein SAMN04487945_1045 [Halobacterium jilantaiense]
MNRRTLLGRAAAAAGASLALAGCLRDGADDEVLEVVDSEFGEDDEGYLQYTVTVSNPSDRAASGTLYVNSELNDNPITKVQEVSLDAHSTQSVTVTYDVKRDELSGSFSPEVDLQEDDD